MALTLAAARTIVDAAIAHARKSGFRPLCVVALDARALPLALATEDGSAIGRFDIARGKAMGALAFNVPSKKLGEMALERPHFMAAAGQVLDGLIPVAGGVLIRDGSGAVIGAVGVSGDSSDNDAAAALAGIAAAGLAGDNG